MAIRITKQISEKKTFAQREKFEETGDYLCEIVSARFAPTDTKFDLRYFIDLKVEEGPALIGKQASWAKFLKEQYKAWKNPTTGASLSAKELEAMDAEQVQVAVAACLGLAREEAGELVDDPQYSEAFDFLQATEAATFDGLVGRKVVAHVYINKKGYITTDLKPASEFGGVKAAPKSAPAAKKAPPAPAAKAKPSLSEAMKAKGFEFHPDDPTYVFNETTEEVIELAEFKKSLGY